MKIPFIDLKAQYDSIKDEIGPAIQSVIDRTAFAGGPETELFEKKYADYIGTNYCTGVNSGTSALHLALLALGIGKGDEVITAPNTFIATCWAISYTGAKPVFADIDPLNLNIDPDKIEEKITDNTKAIIPVHLCGQSAELEPILKIAKKHGLKLLEDAAQAHGSKYNGHKCGTFGDAACFSYYPGKNLGAYGEGGAIVTNDPELDERIKMLRNHGQREKHLHEFIGYNCRMDGIQAAVLNVKLKYIDEWNEKRRGAAKLYDSLLKDIAGLRLYTEQKYAYHVYHLYQIGFETKKERDIMAEHLNSKGIATGMHYPVPVHLQKAYGHLGYKKGDFPETEKMADCNLTLPIYPEISNEQIEYVAENIRSRFDIA
ncbi:MAG: DegT/DnrJ/EryC1/StrS family aminotransferase [Candidatus Kapaibacterium sp.]